LLPRTIEASPVTAVEFLDLANAPALGELADVVALIQSSDSHRNEEIGRRRTHLDADELSFDGIRRALSRSRAGER
jgi:PHP family Zn ribbon phosphoesterase